MRERNCFNLVTPTDINNGAGKGNRKAAGDTNYYFCVQELLGFSDLNG
jgi:hypothetical protein